MSTDDLPADYYAHTAPIVSDWASMVTFAPGTYFRPKSLDEVASVLSMLANGALGDRQLRVLGGLHSCSTIFQSDVVLDTTELPLEFSTELNPDGSGNVIASAFMHAHEFLRRAATQNLSLTALGGTDAQTLAGLISTNTAGATVHHSVYETLQWVEYLKIAPDGHSVISTQVKASDPQFAGVIASLGAIGFMTRVCFNLVPQRFYTGTFELAPLQSILGNIQATCDAHDFWRIEWIPESDNGLFWHADAATTPVDPDGDYPVDGTENILKLAMGVDQKLFHNGPFLNAPLLAAYKLLQANYSPVTASGPMRNIIPCDRLAPLHVAMAEWSFDPADLPSVMNVCRNYWNNTKWPNLPTEIECTRTDSYWMSAWNWPDLPYIVKLNFQYLTDFLSDPDKEAAIAHLNGLWNALLIAGIPFKAHWGKINFLNPALSAKLYAVESYAPMIQNLFMNEYLAARLPSPTEK